MHQEKLIHGDLKSTNFIIGSDGIAIIDLDAMKVGNSQTNMKAVVRKQMKRFMENWQDNAEAKSIFEEIVPADVRKSS